MRSISRLLLPVFLALAPMAASAQLAWPTHPLRLIVPFPAGGSADVQSRVIAQGLSEALGQPVVVDNRPGAGGNVAAAEASRAQPDGYTLFMATTGTNASNVSLYKDLGFDPAKDFAPLTLVTLNPQLIVAAPKYGDIGLAELVTKLKAAGTSASFGSSGIGSSTHIAGVLFNRITGAAMVHVPYRGQGPALNDLLANRIDVMFPLLADVFAFIQGKQLKAFTVINAQRAKALPDVATTAELGFPKIVLTPIWTALYTNAGTPKPVVERLNHELVKIITAPAFISRFEAAGYEIKSSTPDELTGFAATETQRWGTIIKDLNIQME
ncbi:MAG TPA: tripartite tricarboxylate transporter substrate-binding protein [Xanthobacteraceae bacterium]|nr:tripartite tricarboxylate transporter substrate-binding protein [Xanthobacteraceae bacterium]